MVPVSTKISPLLEVVTPIPQEDRKRQADLKEVPAIVASALILLALATSILAWALTEVESPGEVTSGEDQTEPVVPDMEMAEPSKGVSEGVTERTYSGVLLASGHATSTEYVWSNVMLVWQRTVFHFQPEKNWMNDPNGPLYHKGWYHIFYQWNPEGAAWGNKISWGHAVDSKDLLHWYHLPWAMYPDQPYDLNGVWTGSATTLPDGKLAMLYTGETEDELVQDQCLADPVNPTDPLLVDWVKYSVNPVIYPPPGIGVKDFRDPTTACRSPAGNDTRLITIGSKLGKTGISLVYETTNFTTFKLLYGVLHAVPGTGMWECVDLYPVSTKSVIVITQENGLDTSVHGLGVKHVLKTSFDDDKHDYYALGTYDLQADTFVPDDPDLDVGIGLRLDYGKYYAARTFYNQNKQRRILWGWIGETDLEAVDPMKGWASLQAIPRSIVFDKKTGTNVLQRPEEEVESWSTRSKTFHDISFEPGSVVPIHVTGATQLDITASFEVDETLLETTSESHDAGYDCSNSGGAGTRGSLGPFGLLVVADEKLSELTPVYLYVAKGGEGKAKAHLCTYQTRSSMASGVEKDVYGSAVPVLDGENYSARILTDHSIVESFAQAGRTSVRSRDYPTKDIYGAARSFFFNNATEASVRASLKAWQTKSFIRPYPFIPDPKS
uniref:beta-fructofuranosidase n=1 Tax=Oryza sativa TaxID=4530 RepID=Q94C08_ORYSA|nr:soluble acid invertase bfruct2 [Oryza sativa Japonica Group]